MKEPAIQTRFVGMELTDISQRIFGQHWRLIVLCGLLAAVVAVLLVPHPVTYTASARLVMDGPDPQTNAETTGISDTVQAIATSPAEIRAAMRDAGIRNRNPVTLAQNSISVASLGQSTVVALSVSDRNPHVAAGLANALAAEVIRTRLAVTRGSASRAQADLTQRIGTLDQQIVAEDNTIDRLTISLAGARDPSEQNTLRAEQGDATRQRDLLTQTRASLEAQNITLLSTSAASRTPSIISPAGIPRASNGSGIATDFVLGAFLGLIIGIALASVLESVRPTLISSDAVAAQLDAPLLGTLATEPGNASPMELGPLALRLRLAGKAAGLPNIRLVAVDEETDLSTFARWLDETWSLSGSELEQRDSEPSEALETAAAARKRRVSRGAATRERPYRIRAFEPEAALMNGAHIGIVVISPDRLAVSELAATKHLLRITPGSVLGVVTYRRAQQVGV